MIVLDTHALVWWLTEDKRVSATAKRAIQSALKSKAIAVSAISVLEIATAVRRGRLALDVTLEQWLEDLRLLPEVQIEPVSAEIALLAGSFDEMHGDPADRVIAATAIILKAKLITVDDKLRLSPRLICVW